MTLRILLVLLVGFGVFSTYAKRPNILFIIADDQSPFDFKSYTPSSVLDAPAIGKLAAEGMTLDRAYHMGSMSGAVCSPSRRMIMTGRTVWHLQGTGGKRNKKKEDKSGMCRTRSRIAWPPSSTRPVTTPCGPARMEIVTAEPTPSSRCGTTPPSAAARRSRAVTGTEQQVLNYLSRPGKGQGRGSVLHLLWLFPSARRAGRHARTAQEVRGGEPSRHASPCRRPILRPRGCPSTGCRSIPFTTAIPGCGTRCRSAGCGSGATR